MFATFHDITVPILQELLPICGMTNASGTYTANQSAQSTITIIVDKVAAVHKYPVCRMARMIIRGQTGTLPCSIECQWIAEDEIEDSGTSWVDGTIDNIIAFPGSTYAINGTPVNFDRFAFVIDNKLIPSWNNSLTVTDVGNGPRQTLLATSVPYIAGTKDFYWDFRDTLTAATDHVLAITNGSDSLTINIPNAVLIPESPSIEGAMEEIRLPMTWEAHRVSGTEAFNLVLVSA
jgi:hypothetical protein